MRQSTLLSGVAATAASVFALPATIREATTGLSTRQDVPVMDFVADMNFFCHGSSLLSQGEAYSHWALVGASDTLNAFDTEHGPKNWLFEMEKKANGGKSDTTDAMDCGFISGECSIAGNQKCEAYYEEVKARGGDRDDLIAYWIFQNVRGLNAFLKEFYHALEKEEASTSSKIDLMVEELGGRPEDTSQAMEWFNIALALAEDVPGVSSAFAPYNAVSGILEMGESEAETPSASNAKDAFGAVMRNLKEALEHTLQTIVGNEDHFGLLGTKPVDSQFTYGSRIAQFLDTGAYLAPLNGNDVMARVQATLANFQTKIAVDTMRARGFMVMMTGAPHVTDESGCIKNGVTKGYRRWLEFGGNMWCVQLYEKNRLDMWKGPGEDYWQKMQQFGITSENIDEVYKNAMNCAINQSSGENRKLDYSAVREGNLPKCFYDLRVIENVKGAYQSNPDLLDNRSGAYHEHNPRPGDKYLLGSGIDNDKGEYTDSQ